MPRRRPRLLYLAFYFPPSRASGVYRPRATANRLVEEGWDVTVFAAPLPFLYDTIGSVDEKLMDTIDPRIRLVRPNLNRYTWQTDLRDFSGFRGRFPHLAHSLHMWGQNSVFPDRYLSWARASVAKALRMHARRRFDLVLATGNPFASFGAAWLFNKLTRTPYIIDYRDSWTLDQFKGEARYEDDHPAWRWERRMLKAAANSVYVNDAQREWHAERYPEAADRMMTVLNGWDADTLAGHVEPPPIARAPGDRPLRFSFVGTVTDVQPIEEMLEGFARAREYPDVAGAELNLYGYFGFFRGSVEVIRRRFAEATGIEMSEDEQVLAPGVRYCGPVSKTELVDVYRDSDVLVFLNGGGKYVTTGKIFEYMAAGRPIVSVHAPGGAAEALLKDYPLWFNPGGLDPAGIASSMVEAAKAATGLDQRQVDAARACADRYERGVTLEPLVERLTELAARKRAVRG
ncbi:glycosyltransferase involved in cell wall biosynthesis [Actinomadura pelletieri DSM 43383]|uniref:Glycosyltransferase involved in cell wall biosynthesis n=1 Tax=Actinomadura pelletieri DSM 43383 TaxID=1120940 RepID=A0A495QA93_9ACTN|nr:glycosyltransferase [Actinomadura pelletieri]RKS68392.1 glycosyltransferase involved in cell wall biosynthesis [Actinomadura pelletieri DSM 43383]